MPKSTKLSLKGWHRRDAFLDANPHLRTVLPNKTSLDWALRRHHQELKPFTAKLGNATMIHSAIGPTLVKLLLRMGESEVA